MHRRTFLKSSAGIAAVLTADGLSRSLAADLTIDRSRFAATVPNKSKKSLRILFLGGTGFLGAPTVHRLIERGHQVTLFNRGITSPQLFPEVENLRGNRYPERDTGLQMLGDERTWDVVIDTWRENPKVVDASIELLKSRVGLYIYVSSIAVYGNKNYETVSPITEDTQLPSVNAPTGVEDEVGYRTAKILADSAVLNSMGTRGVTLRPHGIYGYYMSDESDGQAYWPITIDRGGDVLCPGDGLDGIQFIDVLDVADFIIMAAEQSLSGPFNMGHRLTFREFLEGLQAIASSASNLHWVEQQALTDAGIRPYSNVPLWVPRNLGPGFHNISDERAVNAGLKYREFEKTFIDVIDGLYARKGRDHEFASPILSSERSQQILTKLELIGR